MSIHRTAAPLPAEFPGAMEAIQASECIDSPRFHVGLPLMRVPAMRACKRTAQSQLPRAH